MKRKRVFNTTLTDLQDLASISGSFSDKSLASEFDTPIANDEQLGVDLPLPSSTYTVGLFNECKSHSVPVMSFTNKIKSISISHVDNEKIIKVLKLNGTTIDTNTSFLVQDDSLDTNSTLNGQRTKYILEKCGIPVEDYEKWYFKPPNSKDSKGAIRIYTKKDIGTNVLTIMLIDPHHLFATTDVTHFDKVKLNQKCISDLLKKI